MSINFKPNKKFHIFHVMRDWSIILAVFIVGVLVSTIYNIGLYRMILEDGSSRVGNSDLLKPVIINKDKLSRIEDYYGNLDNTFTKIKSSYQNSPSKLIDPSR